MADFLVRLLPVVVFTTGKGGKSSVSVPRPFKLHGNRSLLTFSEGKLSLLGSFCSRWFAGLRGNDFGFGLKSVGFSPKRVALPFVIGALACGFTAMLPEPSFSLGLGPVKDLVAIEASGVNSSFCGHSASSSKSGELRETLVVITSRYCKPILSQAAHVGKEISSGAQKVQRLGGEETITRPRAPDTGTNGDDIVWTIGRPIEVGFKRPDDNKIDDKIEITPKELLNSAVFNWSRVVSMFSLNGTELLYTRGDEEIIDLASTYLDAAEKSVKEEWEVSLVGDGTGQGGRQMVGLGGAIPIVPNTGVYGNVDRALVPNWRTSTFNIPAGDVSGFTVWDATTVRPIIDRISLARSRNGRYADLLIADARAYESVAASFVAHQRLGSERLGKLGFAGLTYMTPAGAVDVVAAGGIGNVMPTQTVYGIDTEGLSVYTFPKQEFVPFHEGDGMRPINQDAYAQGIVWSGQLVLENPIFSYRIITA